MNKFGYFYLYFFLEIIMDDLIFDEILCDIRFLINCFCMYYLFIYWGKIFIDFFLF